MARLSEERLRELEKYLTGCTGPKHEFYQYWSREDGFFWEERTGHRFVNPCLAARCVEAELEGPLLFPELYLEGGDGRAEEWKRIVPAWASDVLSRATGLSDVTRAARLCRLADLVYRERAFRDAGARR